MNDEEKAAAVIIATGIALGVGVYYLTQKPVAVVVPKPLPLSPLNTFLEDVSTPRSPTGAFLQ